jgi:PAS domain S-box-containing protein
MNTASRLSRADLKHALSSLGTEHVAPDMMLHLLRELERHQLELELQNHELRETQQELEESRSRYADLYDFAPMACLSLDSRACIQELNLAGGTLLRRDRAYLRGQPFAPFVSPRDISRFLTFIRRCSEGESLSTELGLRIDKSRIEVRLHGTPIEGGGPQGRMCRVAILDITELREMQIRLSLAERLATVGTLAGGVAHEINNPLAFVLAQLDLAVRALQRPGSEATGSGASEDPRSAAALQLLADARLGAERIQDIVKDLSSFARPAEAHTGQVDAQQVMELSVKMAMAEIRPRARLVRDYVDAPAVTADGSRLGQVFLNLLVNAAHAIPEGAPASNEIRLRIWPSQQSVVVEIQDTGHGIESGMLDRIFEPFFTTKSDGQGLGLGLAISHSLVTELGGELTVQSEPGRGSTFRVRLPAAPPPRLASPPPPSPQPQAPLRRGLLLIVDDDRAFGRSLQAMLSGDHDPIYVPSARAALDRIAAGARYDAVICDLMMAEMTGKQFYDELSQRAPDQARRIIFMTGGAYTPVSMDFVAKMSHVVLNKPFKQPELEKLLAPLLQ